MTLFEQEIAQQQYVLYDTFETNRKKIAEIAKRIRADKIKGLAVTARGSSKNACWYLKYLIETQIGIPVVFINPSVVYLYNGKYALKDFLLFAVSQSGRAEDILQVVRQANDAGVPTVAVTNAVDSPIALNSEEVLFLNVGQERSVAASKTFLAQMTVFYMLATALEGGEPLFPDVDDGIKSLFDDKEKIAEMAQNFERVTDLFVLARGLNYVSAEEIALKFKETCYLNASSYSLSEFQHGPFALLEQKSTVILLGSTDPTADSCKKLADKIKATGARLCVLSSDFRLVQTGDFGRVLPRCQYLSTPFLQVVAGQLLVSALSGRKGLNPDGPRYLKKVTVTE